MRRFRRLLAPASLVLLCQVLAFSYPVAAQSDGLGDPGGPGQAVSRPPSQCAQTLACTYNERNLPPAGYSLQSLQVCGANCTTQYWVSGLADGQEFLELDPVRGGAVLAVSATGGMHPPMRVVAPRYALSDPACCPSGFADTTYTWDPDAGQLNAGNPTITPADQFPGWDAVRGELQAEGWLLAD
jgi:hypothetical protein